MARGWYNNRAIDAIDAKLALEAAGAGAKAFSKLAKIPLDIDDRKMRDRKIAVDENANLIRQYDADQRVKGAKISASGKVAAATLGLKGREAAAIARQYDADQRVKGAKISASGKVVAATLGLKGREAAAFARQYDADVAERNNIRTNDTAGKQMNYDLIEETIKGANQKDVAKINKSAKSPTEKITYGKDNNVESRVVTKAYKEKDLDTMTVEDLAKEAKKVKKQHGQR